MSNQQGSGKPPGPGGTTAPGGHGQPNPYAQPPQPQPQPYPQAPYPQPQPQPQPYPQAPYPQAQPYLQQPPNAYVVHGQPSPFAPPAMPPPAPWQPPGPPPAGPPPVSEEAGMFGKAFARAFRLRIEPHEVTASEHAALARATPPITEPYLKAFLTWRRSVLFLVAVMLIPLTILRFVDMDKLGEELKLLFLVPAAAEAFLCLVCWFQLAHWTHWRRQRRALFRAWLVFMAAPFVVFLLPAESLLTIPEGAAPEQIATAKQAVAGLVAGFALLTLAPKAVSLLAGTIRAGIVTKMLFPGSAGPGWIVVFATPIYTLFVFTLLIVPYQITGSGWYFGAMAALAVGQVSIGRAGYKLAKPMTHADAVGLVGKARGAYVVSMIVFGVCIIAALGSAVKQIGIGQIISFVLSFEANVLILTLIGSDLVITNLERARGLSSGTTHLVDETNRQLGSFVGET